MSYVRQALNAHVQDNILGKVVNSFTTYDPIWYLLGAGNTYDRRNPYLDCDAGRPSPARMFGMPGMTKAEKKTQLGSQDAQPTFVTSEPDDGATVSYGGSMPTTTGFSEDRFGTCKFRWTHFAEPVRIRKHSLMMARGDTAVRNLADRAAKPVIERLFKRVTNSFWAGTLSTAQQNATIWDDVLGIEHQVGENNVFGTVDRAVETELNANVLAAGTDTDTTTVSLDLISKINHGFTKSSGGDFEGVATKTTDGSGANVVLTTPQLWQSLKSEAEGHYQIYQNGIPNSGLGGFKRPIIEYDNAYITYSPFCSSGTMELLNLDTWSLEIQSGYDWVFSGFVDNTKVAEGGGAYEWGYYEYMPRLICHAPHLQTEITGLVAA